jgi:large subunit ribosomal protein L19
MPYLHFSKRRNPSQPREKFRSPQRRASKLLHELSTECVERSKAAKPAVFGIDFAVGDAIELQIVDQGGVDSTTDVKKVRGVVIGKFSRGLDTAVQIRDVVMGTIVERRLPLHSPLVRNIRLIERNFVYKGRRKVKRAKLYFLRDRNPNGTSLSFLIRA